MTVLLSDLYTVLPGFLKLLHPGLPGRQNASHSGFILHHFWENPSQPSEGNEQKSAQTWDNIHKNWFKGPTPDNHQQIGPKSDNNQQIGLKSNNNQQTGPKSDDNQQIGPKSDHNQQIGRSDEIDQLGKPHLDSQKTSLLIDGQPSGHALNNGEIEKIIGDHNPQNWEIKQSKEAIQNNNQKIGRSDEIDQLGKQDLDNNQNIQLNNGEPSGQVWDNRQTEKTIGDENPQNWEKIRKLIRQNLNRQQSLLNNGQPSGHIWNKIQADKNIGETQSKELIWGNNQQIGGSDETDPLGKQGLDNNQPIQLDNGQPSEHGWDKTIDNNEQQNWKNGQPVRNPFHHQQVQLNNGQLSGHVWDNGEPDKNIGGKQSKETFWGNNQQIDGSDETDSLGKQGLDNNQPIQLDHGQPSGHGWDKNDVDNEWQNWKNGQPISRWVDFQICSF